MKLDRWREIEKLYHAALDQRRESRDAFLEEACRGDQQLLDEVARLLDCDDSNADFIETPALTVAARALASESVEPGQAEPLSERLGKQTDAPVSDTLSPGQTLGHFRILRKIDRGGMGEVYEAEDTTLERRVAVKLLHLGGDSSLPNRLRLLAEARSASLLNHPNIVTVHSIEQFDGLDFIVMEYVDGETLRACIDRGPLQFSRVVDLALQVAEAVAAAHAAGIVHRDLKPANILVTAQGRAKVLDFGLAKRLQVPADSADDPNPSSMARLSSAGFIVGSAAYMSPEQTRGEPLDARSDVFSLGSIWYEAATGRRAFNGPTALEVIHQIATFDPPPPSAVDPRLPPEFDGLIERSLAKAREDRFDSAAALARGLRDLAITAEARRRALDGQRRRRTIQRWTTAVSIAVLLVAAAGLWIHQRNARLRWAADAPVQIQKLASERDYVRAHTLALEALPYLPDASQLVGLMPTISDDLSVTTDPPGANVYLRRFSAEEPGQVSARRFVGATPIRNLQVPRAEYVIEMQKDGYATFQRTISSELDRVQGAILGPAELPREVKAIRTASGELRMHFDSRAPIEVRARLVPASEAPERMVFVPGGEYALVGFGRPTHARVRLDDYFIDQFEVSNREYQEFIKAGGYLKPQFWKHPFRQEGRELSWEVGIRRFRDRTGQAGPRSWSNQTFPAGKAEHPVTDVSWYEAAAYAEFRGKQLPTVFQWEKAARDGAFTHVHWLVMPWGLTPVGERLDDRANFLGTGTAPVEGYAFGMSPYGCRQMAGNVAEWCLNQREAGFTTAGGSWKDPLYMFAGFEAFPGFYSANTLGFRCVLNAPQTAGDQGAMPIDRKVEVLEYAPASESQYRSMLRHYEYDRTPLDPVIEEVIEHDVWRREKIAYNGAGGERAFAYLYLPRRPSGPLQAIHYVPSDAAYYGLSVPEEVETHAAPYILAGRAVFSVVLKGYKERPWPVAFTPPALSSVAYRDMVVKWAIDLQRGLDLLEAREEVDAAGIAAFGVSVNNRKLTLIAVEPRYRAIVLLGAGLVASWGEMVPEANGLHFMSHIRAPKLMIHGRYDEAIPFQTEGKRLYELLREPKRLVLVEQGHVPPLEITVPIVNGFLDETMGPVEQGARTSSRQAQ